MRRSYSTVPHNNDACHADPTLLGSTFWDTQNYHEYSVKLIRHLNLYEEDLPVPVI